MSGFHLKFRLSLLKEGGGKMAKLHWAEGKQPGDVLYKALCGWLVPVVAQIHENVTCKDCSRILCARLSSSEIPNSCFVANVPFVPRPVIDWREVFSGIDARPLIDEKTGFPFIKQRVISALRCSCHRCETCRGFLDIERMPSDNPWKDGKRIQREFRWPNVASALEWFIDLSSSGYPTKSVSETLSQLGIVGALIRTTNAGQSTATIRAAEDHVEVERALSSIGSVEKQIITLARTVGKRVLSKKMRSVRREPVPSKILGEVFAMSENEVLSTAKRGRLMVYQYLRPRGFIPEERRRTRDVARIPKATNDRRSSSDVWSG
jgi:hypothetical protein